MTLVDTPNGLRRRSNRHARTPAILHRVVRPTRLRITVLAQTCAK